MSLTATVGESLKKDMGIPRAKTARRHANVILRYISDGRYPTLELLRESYDIGTLRTGYVRVEW